MEIEELKKFIKEKLQKNNKINRSRLTKKWFEKNNFIDYYNYIFEITSYFDKYSNEANKDFLIFRIKDILNNTFVHLCKICKEPLNFIFKTKSHEHWPVICNKKECHSKSTSIALRKSEKVAHPSRETILKRINSRKNNGKPWNTPESNLKSSISNSRTWKKIWQDENLYKEYKEKFLKERREKHSLKIKKLIAEGKFTPCVTNSWANSRCKIKIDGFSKFYRSSWEAAFQILNPDYEYEKIRIPYLDEKNICHSYIVDFFNPKEKILVEIKPDNCKDTELNKLKFKAAKEWCSKNNCSFKIISNDYFVKNAKNIDYKKYDKKIFKGMQQFL